MAQKAAVDSALQANKDHQYALKVYTERLEAELNAVDKLISAIDDDDDADDAPDMGAVLVAGAVKPVSIVLPKLLLSEDSPFHEDAQRKKRYDEFTTVNQMKTKEHDALRDAIRIENQRMYTLDAQSRGQQPDLQAFPPQTFEQNTEGIDWRRVAVKINSAIPSGVRRNPKECEIRWLGHLHPSINQSAWAPEEIERLRAVLEEENTNGDEHAHVDWTEVAKKLGTNRSPIDCMRHGMVRRVHAWSAEADQKLRDAIAVYGQNNWQISKFAMNVSEDTTAHQCQKRFYDSLDPALAGGPWSEDEDNRLLRAVAAFTGASPSPIPGGGEASTSTVATTEAKHTIPIPWQDVALFVPGRNNNQCRERYQDTLTKPKKKERGKGKGKATPRAKRKEADAQRGPDAVPEDEGAGAELAASPRRAKVPRRPKPAYKGKEKGPGRGKRKAKSAASDSDAGTGSGGDEEHNRTDAPADADTEEEAPEDNSGPRQGAKPAKRAHARARAPKCSGPTNAKVNGKGRARRSGRPAKKKGEAEPVDPVVGDDANANNDSELAAQANTSADGHAREKDQEPDGPPKKKRRTAAAPQRGQKRQMGSKKASIAVIAASTGSEVLEEGHGEHNPASTSRSPAKRTRPQDEGTTEAGLEGASEPVGDSPGKRRSTRLKGKT
ncbi:hypothetical protein DFH11DRAFT_1545076 [Phellopilus nigrolimitatus]|nr:hypothetical protein DFH11DRAFT_1545076 [Phellopilus nigrolimitatus]